MGTSGEKWRIITFFIGTYHHNLDEKNRFILPSKLREKLGGTIYVTLGLDKCLTVYPEETYMKLAENLNNASFMHEDNRNYKRTFFGNSYELTLDKQGRVTLDKNLCLKVGITKEIVVVGVQDHVEVWDKERYERMEEANDASYEDNAARVHYGE
jgi:MraZ protein